MNALCLLSKKLKTVAPVILNIIKELEVVNYGLYFIVTVRLSSRDLVVIYMSK